MLETSLQCGSNSSKQSKSEHKLTVRSVPNLDLRKKWYYINLKGKTQGKGEKQGPSVENKPFLWVRIEKICPDTFWSMDASGRKWTQVDAVRSTVDTFLKMSQKSQITLQNVYRLCRAMFYVENKPSVWFKLVQTV